MNDAKNTHLFLNLALKSAIVHTLTYFIFGLVMSNLFDYKNLFASDVIRDFMKPIDSGLVLAGPFLQPLRGILFALAIWPIYDVVFKSKKGWLKLWLIIVILGILSTPAASPCSMEGIIYTRLPLSYHLTGFPEITVQTLAYSWLLVWWVNRAAMPNTDVQYAPYKRVFLRILFAIMISCFGYIGYAIGAILNAKLAGMEINVDGSAIEIKRQLVFVFGFIVNFIAVFVLSLKSFFKRFKIWQLFLIFFLLDSASLLIYQAIFLRMMPIHSASLIGFFPALIIAFSFWRNRNNFDQINK